MLYFTVSLVYVILKDTIQPGIEKPLGFVDVSNDYFIYFFLMIIDLHNF